MVFPELCPWNSHHDLAAVVNAWPHLPEALKAGILAMVKAALGEWSRQRHSVQRSSLEKAQIVRG